MPQPQPWDQRQNEGPKAYSAFVTYRELGSNRSVDKAYHLHCSPSKADARAPKHWWGWSKKYDWPARAMMFDAHAESLALASREKVVEKFAAKLQEMQEKQRQCEMGTVLKLWAKVDAMLEVPLFRRLRKDENGRIVEVFEPVRWDLNTTINMASLASKLGRIVAQMPVTVAEASANGTPDELFTEHAEQLVDRLPAGTMPPMPADPAARPSIGQTVAGGRHDLIQPGAPVRPGNGNGHNGNGKGN